jgi:NitT/TauT family transport system substrate-binding protein
MLSKKYVLLIIFAMMICLLSSCKNEKTTMIVPAGSPQFAQLYMQDSNNYDVTIVEGADPLVAAFGSSSYDVIVAPTNLGAKLYDAKPDYQLIATISWGSYYLISKSNIDEMETLDIVAFGQNQIPDALMQYVLEGLDIEFEVEYLDSVSSVASDFVIDGSKVYLMSEPSLSVIASNNEGIDMFDLQSAYYTLTGYEDFPQASVFVHQSLTDQDVQKIKDDFASSIDLLHENLESSADLAKKLGISMDKEIIIQSIPRSNIEFKDSQDIKGDIIFFLGLLKGFNPNFVGENLPNDTFYR